MKTALSILAATLLILPVRADPLPTALRDQVTALIKSAQASNLGYELVESLTTEIGPRLPGSPEEARARDWAVAKFIALGFANVRVENFEVQGWQRHHESAAIVSPNPQPLAVTALGFSYATPPEGLVGDVVRFDNMDALRASSDASDALAGRIVFVDDSMTRTKDGSGYGPAASKRNLAAIEGMKRGAIAALIRSVATSNHRFPHTGKMAYAEVGESIPAAALAVPDADQLTRALENGPVTVRLSLDTDHPGLQPSGNVIAEIPGRELPDEIVLLGAHLDSWDLGTGALDDGAGVAIVTAAARLIIESGLQPRRTIRVVLFGAEETGVQGGKFYAKQHAYELPNHIAVVEADLGTNEIWRFDSNVAPVELPLVDAVHTLLEPLGISRGHNKAAGGPDIGSFVNGGATVFELFQNAWDYFDYHHTADDTLDKIDPEKLRQNIAAYAAFAWAMAESAETR